MLASNSSYWFNPECVCVYTRSARAHFGVIAMVTSSSLITTLCQSFHILLACLGIGCASTCSRSGQNCARVTVAPNSASLCLHQLLALCSACVRIGFILSVQLRPFILFGFSVSVTSCHSASASIRFYFSVNVHHFNFTSSAAICVRKLTCACTLAPPPRAAIGFRLVSCSLRYRLEFALALQLQLQLSNISFNTQSFFDFGFSFNVISL